MKQCLKIKIRYRRYAVSPVIGIVVLLVIILGIAGVIYTFTNETTEDMKHSFSQYITVNPFPDEDIPTSASLTIGTSSKNEIFWNDITCNLVDIDEAKTLEDGEDIEINTPPLDNAISSGQIISIEKYGEDGVYLKAGHKYKFTLYYAGNFMMLGQASWTQ